jgi:hypothetical protein
MMLQIDHRESNDVDIFLSDAQLLQFLDPQKRDFQFEIPPDDYRTDGVRSIKFAFNHIGQIDFIVARALTLPPATEAIVDDRIVQLETIPEIITKKIYHRGLSLQSRDIFDIAAAAEQHAETLIAGLKLFPDRVAQAITTLSKLNAEFVNRAIQQLAIKDRYSDIAKTALERSKELLRAAA